MPEFFADIILPFALEKNYTYSIPDDMLQALTPGIRVEVPFKSKTYTGIVARIHDQKPEGYVLKPILSLPDHLQVVNKIQLDFWAWMADYYMCSVGDVMQAALPAPYKLSSETILVLEDEKKIDSAALNDKEFIVAEALTMQKKLTLQEIQKILRQKSVQPIVKVLIEKGIAFIKEELKGAYKARTEKYILLNKTYQQEEALRKLFDQLEKFPKQLHILMMYYQLAYDTGKIKRAVLLRKADATAAVLQTMLKKEIFFESEEGISRLPEGADVIENKITLSPAQNDVLDDIEEQFKEKNVILLHGVTGSGKTEVYIELIRKRLADKKQVLYMLPEIALTAQIVNRLKKHFGNVVGVYHSKFNQNERIEIWQKVLNQEYQVLLGARSSLFLPFRDLDLVIIDEEHDYSYKQQEPNPRYHGRDAAIYLAHLHNAKTILGTATPSIETFYHTQTKKYGLVKLYERYSKMEMPEIKIVPVIKTSQNKNTDPSHFTAELTAAIKNALLIKEQVILFQNRRGFAPFVICEACGWVPQCVNCDVKLVYHKFADELRCHYCGYKHKTFPVCPACNSSRILIQGLGTEKIEDELNLLFPEQKIARLDLDAVRTKHGHEKIIRDFEDGEIDILVGTQMVTKGLDFDNVNLVGIMSADQIINYSEFRANERAFQLMTQVSGRAGRKNRKGLVLIQAIYTKHPVLQYVIDNNYPALFENEILQRQQFLYPPFTRLLKIVVKHKQTEIAHKAANFLVSHLIKLFGKKVLGPSVPNIARIRNKYNLEITVKMDTQKHFIENVKKRVKEIVVKMQENKDFRQADIVLDVDPL
ncbi:MAG: primosomal protein N' [Chitinophagales bacterium]|nr:primosomal protein N' [Chitinophagales bacterium]